MLIIFADYQIDMFLAVILLKNPKLSTCNYKLSIKCCSIFLGNDWLNSVQL